MSDEDFLKRWSRRKREVAKEEPASRAAAPEAGPQAPEPAAVETKPPFDPASLPPVESITSLSDITGFLREGVPAELARAALRRVWTADPAIRDFVGLAENAWDFTDPNAMPGFGPLEDTAAVRQMIARVIGEIGQTAQPDAADLPPQVAGNSNYSNAIVNDPAVEDASRAVALEDEPKQNPAQALSSEVSLQRNKENIAAQHDVTEAKEKPKQSSRRFHGGALPR